MISIQRKIINLKKTNLILIAYIFSFLKWKYHSEL